MTCTAHLLIASIQPEPLVVVRDDLGDPIEELTLPATATPDEADIELRGAGWARHAEWSTAKDGWLAPVVPAQVSGSPHEGRGG